MVKEASYVRLRLQQTFRTGIFEENRLSAHSDHMTSATRREALEEKSSLRLSLNGLWKFTYSSTPALAPANFQDMSVDCHTWGDIRVPAHLEMEGYGVPQYVNTQYPWDGHEDIDPPEVPEKYNPTGNYVRYFTLPDGFIQNGLFCGWTEWKVRQLSG